MGFSISCRSCISANTHHRETLREAVELAMEIRRPGFTVCVTDQSTGETYEEDAIARLQAGPPDSPAGERDPAAAG